MGNTMKDLEGRVALVTGAARGMGRAFSVEFARRGALVVGIDASKETASITYPAATKADLDETVRLVEAEGSKMVGLVGDVRDQKSLDAAVAEAKKLGPLRIVVANAGVAAWNLTWELSEDEWTNMIDINLNGVWRTFKAAIPTMIEHGQGGSIIAISSVAGIKALPGQAHYTAAKHGVVGLVKTAAIELGPHNIRVNSVHPWGVNTTISQHSDIMSHMAENPHFIPSYSASLANPQIAESQDIANMVGFLASDDARCITGSQMKVDMGATIV